MILRYILVRASQEFLCSPVANIMTCIDDATVSAAFHRNLDTCADKVQRFRELRDEIYEKLGYSLDKIKSIEGHQKFIFLNNLFYKGALIPHGLKTWMKVDKPCD
eukprot:CAMPEP_0201283046 /NCGR_PEP_ID=MMETSP1317-20130820/7416_1 /ASSEMBLY_ACC=CAM_ASM_000770 /TAXON_ID=187299 /ORGANISM="Undescribed Undescribed, Strain Undescribed" /LENGTH=104 /DNA_ID=CAMNT_0047597859 /DNA_START=465 /DNA_END=776 /DNA_ORIENTATION=-